MASVPSAFSVAGGTGIIGPWHLITSTVLSSTASPVTFTSASIVNYNRIWFMFNNLVLSTPAVTETMNFQVSTNGGSSYTAVTFYYANGANSGASAAASVPVAENSSTNISPSYGYLLIDNPNLTDVKPFQSASTTLGAFNFLTLGATSSCAQLNAFQFSLTSGSYTSGTINMYGQ